MPRHNPPESIGCQGRHDVLHGLALHQMAVPAGEGEVRCQALVHFLVALRLHKGQQGSVLPWQGNASQYAALILLSSGTGVANIDKKAMTENLRGKGSFSLRFCCAMLTQAPCLSLVQQGHLLSNESAQRLVAPTSRSRGVWSDICCSSIAIDSSKQHQIRPKAEALVSRTKMIPSQDFRAK